MSKEKATATAIWTQFIDAVKKDYDVDLPNTAGPETNKLIWELTHQIWKEDKSNAKDLP